MKSHGNSGFLVNIRINAKEIITLNELCTSDTKIFDFKEILLKERNLNDIIMEYDKTLSDYNINDDGIDGFFFYLLWFGYSYHVLCHFLVGYHCILCDIISIIA